jgi:hypothetical protein
MSFFLNSYSIYNTSSLDSFNDPYWNNVSLLLHGDGIGATPNLQQNNTFLDSSSNNTITRNGTPTQGSFSPFDLNGVAYSPTLHGGSGFFNSGNVDKLTLPSTVVGSALDYGTGSFTIECWYMFKQVGPNSLGFIISQTVSGDNNLLIAINSSRGINIWLGGANLGTSANSVIPLNTWCHVALVRNGTSVNVYVNGTSVLTRTSAASIGGGMLPCINGYGHADGYGNICYISNMRIVKGLAVYTSNFTPPTSPVTLTSNGGATPSTAPTSGQVSLLCDFTNGGIFDNTKKNVLTTFGNAKVSTSVVKYGTGSMYFDGTGDYLTAPASNNFNFANGTPFTVEFWANPSAYKSGSGFDGYGTIISTAKVFNAGWRIEMATEISFYTYNNSAVITTPISLNTWTHIAVVHDGTNTKMYKDGVLSGSAAATWTASTSDLVIGGLMSGSFTYYYNGYIDDLRITKGVARYTANFTPPARAFPDK